VLKEFQITEVKAGPEDGLAEGEFEAYASVFNNIDSYGDVMRRGSFARTLGEWEAKADVIPVLWGHDTYDPFSNIGGVSTAREDNHGLRTRSLLDLTNPKAEQVYKLLKGRRVNQMSFAFDYVEARPGVVDGKDVLEVFDVDLYEISVVFRGANAETEVLAVKSAARNLRTLVDLEAKSGRVLSAKNESALRAAYEQIGAVLDSLPKTDEERASEAAPSKEPELITPEPKATAGSSVSTRLSLDLARARFDLLD
jgi:HK97 family phage prohead protease